MINATKPNGENLVSPAFGLNFPDIPYFQNECRNQGINWDECAVYLDGEPVIEVTHVGGWYYEV